MRLKRIFLTLIKIFFLGILFIPNLDFLIPFMNNGYMSNPATEFGRLCRAYRANLGLNMIQAAEKIGKKQATITKIELGKIPASLDFIKKSIEVYQIKNRKEKMGFLLTYLKSAKKLEILLNQLGPFRKEWLAALCILGEVDFNNPEGWDDLLQWLDEFRKKLYQPDCVTVGVDPKLGGFCRNFLIYFSYSHSCYISEVI